MVRVLTNNELCCEISLNAVSQDLINIYCKQTNTNLSPSIVAIDLSSKTKDGDLLKEIRELHNIDIKNLKKLMNERFEALDFAAVATSGSYNDLTEKPTIPTVNNATLTIIQGGVSKGTFTANASSDVTVNIDTYDDSGKADINLSNVNATGTSTGAGWAMPSGTYEDLTLGSSGTTYTMPSNGWLLIQGVTTDAISMVTDGTEISWCTAGANNGNYLLVPVRKNQITGFTWANFTPSTLRFFYAVGSESEAS